MRASFRTKLLGFVGLVALAFVVIVAVGAASARRVEDQLASIERHYLPKVGLEQQLEGQLERMQRGFQDAVAAHDPDSLRATGLLRDAFLLRMDTAREAVDPVDASALRAAVEDYFATAYEVSRRIIAGETGEALVDAMTVMQDRRARALRLIEKLAALNPEDITAAFAAAKHAEATAGAYRLWVGVTCLVSVLLLSLGLSRGLLRSVGALAGGFSRFGRGDFAEPILVATHDELGELARDANEMAASLDRLTRERRKAEDRFRDLLEAAPDSVVIVDEEARIVLVNAQTEKLFGYPRDELLERPVEMLMPERYREEHVAHRSGYLLEPTARAMGPGLELYGRRKDGSEFPIEIRLSPLRTAEGELVSSAVRDITERKRTETALKASNQELEAFSYSVAHDLRTPLRGINGLSQVLLEDYGGTLDAQGQDYLNRISAATQRMGQLIDALLGLSRVTRAELKRETLSVTRLADGVVKQLRANHPEREVNFVNQEAVTTEGDAPLLRAVLENLIGNAWKFTAAKNDARIEVGVEQDHGTPVYYVRDNGAGFDMKYAKKLFTPFQRLHSDAEFAGTGIGLATVQRIVHRHGGQIWAEGAVGQGVTVRFTLTNAGGGTST